MNLVLNQKFIVDIADIWKRPIVAMYADTTNYYNRVAYPFVNLYVQYFGLEVLYLLVLFRTM